MHINPIADLTSVLKSLYTPCNTIFIYLILLFMCNSQLPYNLNLILSLL